MKETKHFFHNLNEELSTIADLFLLQEGLEAMYRMGKLVQEIDAIILAIEKDMQKDRT